MSGSARSVTILGSTGTIGANTLEVIRRSAGRFRVAGLACRGSVGAVARQVAEFRPHAVYVERPAPELAAAFPAVRFLSGEDGLEELAALDGTDIVMAAIPGIGSLSAVLAAIERGRTVCLATKEILVAAGTLVTAAAARAGAPILPVDSEHNAVFQLLERERRGDVARIVLTASGGPFLRRPDVSGVTREDVLAHPVWKMGAKITVDSATMMNKCFEMIEAHHLFSLPADRIGVLIHPEAVVHGFVELADGTVKAVLSPPDMKFAISHVLHYPERASCAGERLRLGEIGRLTFEEPDAAKPWMRLARTAIETGGSFPAALICANDEAVALFLEGRIPFRAIVPIVEAVLGRHAPGEEPGPAELRDLSVRTRHAVLGKAREFSC